MGRSSISVMSFHVVPLDLVSAMRLFGSSPRRFVARRVWQALSFVLLLAVPAGSVLAQTTESHSPARPNILWITCEDTSPLLGCYGDQFATTPNLDRFARQSVRYTSAFGYTGVCAPNRSCLITGVYPLRLGSQNMRSTTRLPDQVKCFTESLRDAGYYCSNNSKEDYNFKTPATAWDDSSRKAHWRGRQPNQPFFAVFNFTVCHQSQVFCSEEKYRENTSRLNDVQRHAPADVTIPPIHPDTPEFRREWAWHYDNVTAMDYQVGDVLEQLQQDGLADDTIVFFFSDHGTGMPSIKMFAWESSLRVPLLIRFPERWKGWAPTAAGETCDRLVSFVDFAPTVLSLTSVPIPQSMQGIAFLGDQSGPPRSWIFGGKDRQAECFDMIRFVRNQRFQYNRNFRPELPFGQPMSYLWNHDSLHAWKRLHDEGKLSGPPARFFAASKPVEELYDVQRDPWQIHNLATDPAYREQLTLMRAKLADEMHKAGDLGLLPEGEMHRRAADSTPYEVARDPALNPIGQLLEAAWLANQRDRSRLPQLVKLLDDPDAAVRWWAANGLVALGKEAKAAETALIKTAADSSADVRVTVAEALHQIGNTDLAIQLLRDGLRDADVFVRLQALNICQRIGTEASPLLDQIRDAEIESREHRDAASYVGRMVGYLPEKLAPR